MKIFFSPCFIYLNKYCNSGDFMIVVQIQIVCYIYFLLLYTVGLREEELNML
mgnify:CR=1 FL=1